MPAPTPARFRYWAKIGAAALLVALGDRLFYVTEQFGSGLALFALAWAVATLLMQPAMRRDRRALVALAAAIAFTLVLFDDPNFLAWCLFCIALAMAALLPRTAAFDDAWRWTGRLAVHGATSLFGPLLDARRLGRLWHRSQRPGLRTSLALWGVPIVGSMVFVALFALANPLIGDVFAAIRLPGLAEIDVARIALWVGIVILAWSSLRPRKFRLFAHGREATGERDLAGVSVASITLSLILFNAVFALQNGLDLVYLWSKAGLPEGVTLAQYAHRGAYPLIATALLAGLFVLVTLRPGSASAALPLIRKLVTVWVAQNIFLVASSILRTIDYVDAFSLTRLRIAALAWMVLVAIGLFLICWRMLKGRSGSWLINANAIAAATLLSIASVVDLGAVAAAWNVRHAREVDASGSSLDLCYMEELGASALVSLVTLEQRPIDEAFRARVRQSREQVLHRTLVEHGDGWWTWRNARRLAEARRLLGERSAPVVAQRPPRGCDGQLIAPPAAPHLLLTPAPSLTAAGQ